MKERQQKRYDAIYKATLYVRAVKRATIHSLSRIGRNHSVLRMPMMVFLAAFIFVYNVFYHLFLNMYARERISRALAMLMCAVMFITAVDVSAFMIARNPEIRYVQEFDAIDDITVKYGTSIDDIELPEEVYATVIYAVSEETEIVESEVLESEILESEALETEIIETEAQELETEETEVLEIEIPENEISEEEVVEPETTEVVEPKSESDAEPIIEEDIIPVPEYESDFEAEITTEDLLVTELTEEQLVTEPDMDESKPTEVAYTEVSSYEPVKVTWSCGNYDAYVAGEYVFTAIFKDNNSELLDGGTMPSIKVTVLPPVEVSRTVVVDGIEIHMEALPGVFPEDVELSAVKIEDAASQEKIEDAILNQVDPDGMAEAYLNNTITFDITVRDRNGNEVQPRFPEGIDSSKAVTISFKNVVDSMTEGLDEYQDESLEVYYIDDSLESAEPVNTNVEGNDVEFNPEHFSLYTCTCQGANYKTVSSWSAMFNAINKKTGEIKLRLTKDITISRISGYSHSVYLYADQANAKIHIDLNGHTLKGMDGSYYVINVKAGELTIHDHSAAGTGKVVANNNKNTVYIGGDSFFGISGGTIENNSANGNSVVYYTSMTTSACTGKFSGGCITGTVPHGVELSASSRARVSMEGVCIENVDYGVYMTCNKAAELSLSNGTTIRNYGTTGIYSSAGNIYLGDCNIIGNASKKNTGVSIKWDGKIFLKGGTQFSNNKACDIYLDSYPNIEIKCATLTGSNIGIATKTEVKPNAPVKITTNYVTGAEEKFYSATNSSYKVFKKDNVLVVGMMDNQTIKATAKPISLRNTSLDLYAGTVKIGNNDPTNTSTSTVVKYNADVTLTANIVNNEQYIFKGWYKNAYSTSATPISTSLVYNFKVTEPESIAEYIAVFQKKQYTIQVNSIDTSKGTVTGGGTFDVGESTTITATGKNTGSVQYQFAQWNDGNKEGLSSNKVTATRIITVTENATYTAQFKRPDPDPNATGILFAGVNQITKNPANGSSVLLIGGGDTITAQGGLVAITTLPPDAANLEVGSFGYTNGDTSVVVSGLNSSGGANVKIKMKPDGTTKWKGTAFDNCPGGIIKYYNGKWYYWCSGGAKDGIGPYNAYTYTDSQTFRAGDISAKLKGDTADSIKISSDKRTVEEIDLIVNINKYTAINLQFTDKNIDYVNGDRTIELDIGGVLFTYVLPEAVIGTKQYNTLQDALNAATDGQTVNVVGPAVSEIENVTMKNGVTLKEHDGTTIIAEEESTVNLGHDGTVELTNGTLQATPATNTDDVIVGVNGATVSAQTQITVTTNAQNGGTVTPATNTEIITISPDGDPNHTVEYYACEGEKGYGITGGIMTNENKVVISDGTEYDLSVELGENQKTQATVSTSGSNSGTTTITKGENGTATVTATKANDDIVIDHGDGNSATYTTNSDNTTITLGVTDGDNSKTEVILESGTLGVSAGGEVSVYNNGEKVTVTNNPPSGGSGVITVSTNGDVSVPCGGGANITTGTDGDSVYVSVPKPENGADYLPVIISQTADGVEITAEPGNQVTIGEGENATTYTTGGYDTTFDVKTDSNGDPVIVMTDGTVVLEPGQTITDKNGNTYSNPEGSTGTVELTLTEGSEPEITTTNGNSFTYAPANGEPKTFESPSSGTATFSLDENGEVALESEITLGENSQITISKNGGSTTIQTKEGNQGTINVDPELGILDVEKAGDAIVVDGKTYTTTSDDTQIIIGSDGVEVLSGGVTVEDGVPVIVGGNEIVGIGETLSVAVNEAGNTDVTVGAGGGFTVRNPDNPTSGITLTNSGTTSVSYEVDPTGGVILAEGTEIVCKQGNENVKIKTDENGGGVTLSPSENGIAVSTPVGQKIEINDKEFINKSSDELLDIVVKDGKVVLESGTTNIPEGTAVYLPSGNSIENKGSADDESVTVDDTGNIVMKTDSKVTLKTPTGTNTYTAKTNDTKVEFNPETGEPVLKTGEVNLDKNSSINVIFNTIPEGEETFAEDQVAKVTSTGNVSPTVTATGGINVPQNGSVRIDSFTTDEQGNQIPAINMVAVPVGAQNQNVDVVPQTDGSCKVTLANSGDSVNVNGMEYTTTKPGTQISITETGSTLTSGAVSLDGGKNPKEGINVNGQCVTNTGANGSTVSVEKKDNGTTEFEVSKGGQFSLSVPGSTGAGYIFKNPSTTTAAKYALDTDGNLNVASGNSIAFATPQGTNIAATADGDVKIKVTEDGATLEVEPGTTLVVNGVEYKNTDASNPMTIAIDKSGNPVLVSGKAQLKPNDTIYVQDEDGKALAISKDQNDPTDSNTITVTKDGKISANPGDTIHVGNATYTSKDADGSFKLAYDQTSGEMILEAGKDVDISNGNIVVPGKVTGQKMLISTNGVNPVSVTATNGSMPSVVVPADGNVTIGDKATGKSVEIKLPSGTNDKNIIVNDDGTLSISLAPGEKATIGGIVYTADQAGEIKVNGQTGKVVSNTTKDSDSEQLTEIDPESFNKPNYEYTVPAGETIKVGNEEYTAPDGGMTLIGNPKGNPIIKVDGAGKTVSVGDESYVVNNPNTQFYVNGKNNITLVDNGNDQANSSVTIANKGNSTINGSQVALAGGDDAGYVATYSDHGVVISDVEEDSKLSVVVGNGKNVIIDESFSIGGQTVRPLVITAATSGAAVVIDKTKTDADDNYVTTVSGLGASVMTPVYDEQNNLVGYTVKINPKPVTPPAIPSTEKEEKVEEKAEVIEESEKEVEIEEKTPVVEKEKEVEKLPTRTTTTITRVEEEEIASNNILGQNGLTENAIRDIITSASEDNVEAKEELKDLLQQAIDAGNVIINADTNTVNGVNGNDAFANEANSDNTSNAVIKAQIDDTELVELIDEILTPEEKIAVLSGESVNVRAEIAMTDDEKIVDENVVIAANNNLPSGTQKVAFLNVGLFKQVGTAEEQKVSSMNGEVKVSFEVPAEYQAEDGTPIVYQVMRIYTDEAGVTQTEFVDIVMDGNTIIMSIDPNSEYMLICDEDVALAGKLAAPTLPEEEDSIIDETTESGSCRWHYGTLVLLAIYLAAILALRKKHLVTRTALLAADTVGAVAFTMAGSCNHEVMFLIGNLLVAATIYDQIRRSNLARKYDQQTSTASNIVHGVLIVAGAATLIAATVMSVSQHEQVEPSAMVETVDEQVVETETAEVPETVGSETVIDEATTNEITSTEIGADEPVVEENVSTVDTSDVTIAEETVVENQSPVIVSQPVDVTIIEGNSTSFTVEAEGENLSYQWYVDRGDGNGWNIVGRSTTATHSTDNNVTMNYNGFRYKCEISNEFGTIESDVVTLTVTN